jgi:penicillin amidase
MKTKIVQKTFLSLIAGFAAMAFVGFAELTAGTFTNLDVAGEAVRIYRDDFAVPHILAETNRGLFVAYGYTVAEDRLWQLEINRRSARGRLAEILGAGPSVTADRMARTFGYTETELDAQFAALNAEEQEIFTAYVDGINRYLDEVVAPDPANKLPFEFQFLNIGVPTPWTVRDVVAYTMFAAQALDNGGQERNNQSLLAALIAQHGPDAGMKIFNDIRWLDDPDTHVSVPVEGAIDKRQKPAPPAPGLSAQLKGASETELDAPEAEAKAFWESLGVPTRLGSHGWVVSPAKSENGFAMLFGGLGLGFVTPAQTHEVQLTGGNGFDVAGVNTAVGSPVVFVGRTDHIAWTVMSGGGRNVNTYIETLCDGGAGYLFRGVCTPFESRIETIPVRNSSPVTFTIQFSIHGPVVASGAGVRFTQQRVQWHRELETWRAFLAFDRAHNLDEFEAAINQMPGALNFLYADKSGNIAYWAGGQIPVPPPGFDRRLPLPGDGSAEWIGELLPIPRSINPTRGWLANWNNKPSVAYPFGGGGKYNRLLEIEDRLAAPGFISVDGMKEIEKYVARTDQTPTPPPPAGPGRESRFLKPYLLAALKLVPPTNPLAPQAEAVLEGWNGDAFRDVVSSATLEPGEVIFSKWLSVMLNNTFADELGANVGQASLNMLLHVLDDALGGGSGVTPSRDYFNGSDPNVVISQALDQALAALGSDSAVWSAQPRATIPFRHSLYPVIPQAGNMLGSAHMTYLQSIVLSRPTISSENIVTLGQSGFIGLGSSGAPVFDPHFNDQLELYRNFQYKPMRLYQNTQLQK